MKFIFLDIDGVMIPYWSGHSYAATEKFAQEHVDVLNSIVETTEAHIVLSSCWGGNIHVSDDIPGWLVFCGLSRPDLYLGKTRHYGNRTESIQLYLEKLEYEKCDIESILILDDETISEPLTKHSIKTKPDIGLRHSHLDEALVILNHLKFESIY